MDKMSLNTRTEIRNCVHSRKIQAFSKNPEHPKFKVFKRHLDRCSICRIALAKENEYILNVEGMIPRKLPLESQLSDIRGELKAALKGLKVVDRTSYNFRLNNVFINSAKGLGDTIKNAMQPKFALWLITAVAFGLYFGR
ncbi:MAG: hypothetical protein KAG61_06205 [Bacteriovoracaceae bacterium]|nr:hypothetical protein [Bacteriovoracaceae bacterium]